MNLRPNDNTKKKSDCLSNQPVKDVPSKFAITGKVLLSIFVHVVKVYDQVACSVDIVIRTPFKKERLISWLIAFHLRNRIVYTHSQKLCRDPGSFAYKGI